MGSGLTTTCVVCDGTGFNAPPQQRKGDAVPINAGEDDGDRCRRCGGRGKVLTDLGRAARDEIADAGGE